MFKKTGLFTVLTERSLHSLQWRKSLWDLLQLRLPVTEVLRSRSQNRFCSSRDSMALSSYDKPKKIGKTFFNLTMLPAPLTIGESFSELAACSNSLSLYACCMMTCRLWSEAMFPSQTQSQHRRGSPEAVSLQHSSSQSSKCSNPPHLQKLPTVMTRQMGNYSTFVICTPELRLAQSLNYSVQTIFTYHRLLHWSPQPFH